MSKPLILVVEDDVPVRNLITITLKTHGYRYLTAGTGDGAVIETSSHNPDVVLLDLGLPDMDGVDVIRKIRTWSNLPIIVISARSEDTDKIDALDAGADDYLTKPFSVEAVSYTHLADKFYMSKNHLTAIFKRAAGTTVARYILYKRMTIARKELAEGTPAAEAAIKAGFGDYSSFFRAYRKMFGCAPSDQQAMELPDMDKSGDF